MLKKLNTVTSGIIIGLILPAFLYFILVHPKLSLYKNLEGYSQMLFESLPLFLTRCIFPNALLFFILAWRNQLRIAKGILIITGSLTLILVLINFVFKA